MSETHNTHVSEARQLLASRAEDMRALLVATHEDTQSANTDILDGFEDAYDAAANYGLVWVKYLTNHIDQTVTYIHQLSTGGPGDELRVTFGPNGDIENVTYVYLPWFDRVEIDIMHTDDAETIHDFYATFYADLVAEDMGT